jgi:hypothetical protein
MTFGSLDALVHRMTGDCDVARTALAASGAAFPQIGSLPA